jgi:hypothetical protein
MSKPTRDDPGGRAYLDLQNRARREGRGTQELLTLYVVERWLARLSRSSRLNDFILKGGMLLAAYGRRRPTADADALAQNMPGDEWTVAPLRSGAYTAYRAGLGMSGHDLPEDFADLVQAVAAFGDRVLPRVE